ncbi:MAG: glycyl-radical enzyme activating protein [Lachnospiraceae bacterium]
MDINYEAQGTVFNIQRYSIHDGPGIRTIVFLKGCPLSCRWCSNPESQKRSAEMVFNQMNCVGCGRCVSACGIGAISMANPQRIDRNFCTGCGKCQSACLYDGLELKGELMTVAQVVEQLKKDSSYYRRSDGGITLSGGEPLVQSEFAAQLLMACQTQGWHTAIETTVYAPEEALRRVLPYVDLALIDIKSTNNQRHQEYTGCSNEIILKNAVLASQLTKATVRIPVIPGFNSDPDNPAGEIREICRYAKKLNQVDAIHLLPYHNYGENKYQLTGRQYQMKGTGFLGTEEQELLKQVVEAEGFTCMIGG